MGISESVFPFQIGIAFQLSAYHRIVCAIIFWLQPCLCRAESGAFAGATGLTDITIYAETPPNIDSSAFDGVDKSNVTLHIPAASENDYNNSNVWNEFNIEVITGVRKPQTTQVFVFPNPVLDNFTIGGITENTFLQITDLHGRVVLQQTVAPNEQISAGHLSAGVYLVRVNGETVKIVKR